MKKDKNTLMEAVNEAATDLKNIRENKELKNTTNDNDIKIADVMKNVADSIKGEVAEEYSKTTATRYVEGAREMFESFVWFNKLLQDEVVKIFGCDRITLIEKINDKKESPIIIINKRKELLNLKKDMENLINTYKGIASKEILDIIIEENLDN